MAGFYNVGRRGSLLRGSRHNTRPAITSASTLSARYHAALRGDIADHLLLSHGQ